MGEALARNKERGMGMEKLTASQLKEPERPILGPEVPLTTFRLLRLVGMQEILGESTGPTLYMAGKTVGKQLAFPDVDSFLTFVRKQKIGVPELERVDNNNLIVRMGECMTCTGLPDLGRFLCHFESGLIAGALESILGRRTKSTQTKGISCGDPYCQFEVFLL